MVIASFWINEDDRDKIRLLAYQDKTSSSEIIRRSVKEFVARRSVQDD